MLKVFSLFSKAISPSKVLKTFPSYQYKALENTSILKYTPYRDVNAKYNEAFDSQIIVVAYDKNAPKRSSIYQSNFFDTAYYKNKIQNQFPPHYVPEQQLIISVVEMDKEMAHYIELKTLLSQATSAAFRLAKEKGYKKPLVEYVNDGNALNTAEVEGIVSASLANITVNPCFVCPTHENLFISELLRREGKYLRIEATIVFIVLVIIAWMIYQLIAPKKQVKVLHPAPLPPSSEQSNQNQNQDGGWLKTLRKFHN